MGSERLPPKPAPGPRSPCSPDSPEVASGVASLSGLLKAQGRGPGRTGARSRPRQPAVTSGFPPPSAEFPLLRVLALT